MPFRKGFLHGKNERKLRETFNWEEEEIEKLRGTATSYKHINEIVSELSNQRRLKKDEEMEKERIKNT